jgi:REP element-mobilizing transposase RayT
MKPGSFTQLYIHMVFSPKYRESLLHSRFTSELYSYMGGLLNQKKHKSIIMNGRPDHIHVLVGLNPNISISDTVADLKRSSSLFINEKKWLPGKFQWQDGYGAFSYGRSQLDTIYQYILNQEKHHKKMTFREEYIALLRKFEVEFEEKYLFEFFE